MAKYIGIPPFIGTHGPLCIYKMYGRYFVRTRSSLTGKRVKKDPVFRKTMEYANRLAQASRISSTVYAAISANKKQHSLYRKLTGEAMYWLKHEWSVADVQDFLLRLYALQKVYTPETVAAGTAAQRTERRSNSRKRRQNRLELSAGSYYLPYIARQLGITKEDMQASLLRRRSNDP